MLEACARCNDEHGNTGSTRLVRPSFGASFDRDLSRFLLSLPSRLRSQVNGSEMVPKLILRRAAELVLPSRLMQKAKHGFTMPAGDWLRRRPELLRGILLDERTLSRGYLRAGAIRGMVEDFAAGRCDHHYGNPLALTALMNLEIWHRLYIDNPAKLQN